MLNVMPLPVNCKCGASARIRYKIPVVWVECRRKCGMHTAYYPDEKMVHDPESEEKAIMEWNKMIQSNKK